MKKNERNGLPNGTLTAILISFMMVIIITGGWFASASPTTSQAKTSDTQSPTAQKKQDNAKPQRSRIKVEEELRVALRELRQAIDYYKMNCERGMISPLDRKLNDECYPPNLEVLVKGVVPPNGQNVIRYLRRIPVDPTTGKREWGLRSMQDDPNSTQWGGQNVFDVYSKNTAKSLDGMRYQDW